MAKEEVTLMTQEEFNKAVGEAIKESLRLFELYRVAINKLGQGVDKLNAERKKGADDGK